MSQRCRPGAGLGAGRPKLESWLLNSLAGNLGRATQTLYKRVCVCKMETAPAIHRLTGNELLHTVFQPCRHTLSAQCTTSHPLHCVFTGLLWTRDEGLVASCHV